MRALIIARLGHCWKGQHSKSQNKPFRCIAGAVNRYRSRSRLHIPQTPQIAWILVIVCRSTLEISVTTSTSSPYWPAEPISLLRNKHTARDLGSPRGIYGMLLLKGNLHHGNFAPKTGSVLPQAWVIRATTANQRVRQVIITGLWLGWHIILDQRWARQAYLASRIASALVILWFSSALRLGWWDLNLQIGLTRGTLPVKSCMVEVSWFFLNILFCCLCQ